MYDYQCDVKLVVGNQNYKAHKHVLSKSSMYFEAMFSHDMVEKEMEKIELHEINPVGFSAMMEYFYHGHVTLNPDNTPHVLEAARFFHIEWLRDACRNFLVRRLCLENFESVLELADVYCLGDLRADIMHTISSQFSKLARQSLFMSVSYELLHSLLAEDYFVSASERFILETVLKWLDHDKDERERHALPLLRLIRFCLIDVEGLLENQPTLRHIDEMNDAIEEALDFHTHPTSRCLKASEHTRTRGMTKALVAISCTEFENRFHYIPETKNPIEETVDTQIVDSALEFTSVAVLGNFLFVAGGYDQVSWCSNNCFYMYDPRLRTWAALTPMRRTRVSFPLVASDKGLYAVAGVEHLVVGGRDIETHLSSVEFYDPVSNTWSFVAELPFGVFSCAAVWHRGSLFTSGGITSDPEDNVPSPNLRVLDSRTRAWRSLSEMQVPRQAHAMTSFNNNKLVVFGGYTNIEHQMHFGSCLQNELYDIETDQWSLLEPAPDSFAHLHNGITTHNDSIYVLGGPTTSSERFIHKFDGESETLLPGQYCGKSVKKIVSMYVSVSPDWFHDPEEEADLLEAGVLIN